MQEHEPRLVRCWDAAGRPGAVAVVVRSEVTVLTVPPGEAARLTGPQLTELINVLREARRDLFRLEHQ